MAHSDWQVLLQAGLVGVSRFWQLPMSKGQESHDEIATILREQKHEPHHGSYLLRLAGTLAVCQEAGWVGASLSDGVYQITCDMEPRVEASQAWLALWLNVSALDLMRLKVQCLMLLQHLNQSVPTQLLPVFLDAGVNATMQPFVLSVIGSRGRWLANYNKSWAYARGVGDIADEDKVLSLGSLLERKALLIDIRKSFSARARDLLQSLWRSLPAQERVVLFDVLRVNISAADEDFIIDQLQDRAQSVRSLAADLLALLPQGVYQQRMKMRLQSLVSSKGFEAPSVDLVKSDSLWEQDQLVLVRPKHVSMGDRAWWLFQLVRRTSLCFWEMTTGLTIDKILDKAKKSDWYEALLHGWIDACEIQGAADWAFALLMAEPSHTLVQQKISTRMLNASQRQAYYLNLLKRNVLLSDIVRIALNELPLNECWELDFSKTIITHLFNVLNKEEMGGDNSLRYYLSEMICAIHPDTLSLLLSLPRRENQSTWVTNALNDIEQVAHVRFQLIK